LEEDNNILTIDIQINLFLKFDSNVF
jgi:hypothetical protein